jgi:hypothetical protein
MAAGALDQGDIAPGNTAGGSGIAASLSLSHSRVSAAVRIVSPPPGSNTT